VFISKKKIANLIKEEVERQLSPEVSAVMNEVEMKISGREKRLDAWRKAANEKLEECGKKWDGAIENQNITMDYIRNKNNEFRDDMNKHNDLVAGWLKEIRDHICRNAPES
jgi:hypothetical protein